MNKNICSILISIITLFAACKQSAKQANTEPAALVKHSDSLLHPHAINASKKLSCCIGPPSRGKIKVAKK